MAKKNSKYWQERAEARLVDSEKLGNLSILRAANIYDQAERNIQNRIQSIYNNYAKKGIVEVSQLKEALNPQGRNKFLSSIRTNAAKLGIDINQVYDERYLSRLTRLDALKQQIALEIMAIAPSEENTTRKGYTQVLEQSYIATQQDLVKQGINPSFSTLDKVTMNNLLQAEWYGRNFSSSVWNNVGTLASELPTILGAGIASGESYEKTARVIRDRFGVGRNESVRLIRTETNFFNNQGELQSYIDDGITRYQFEAFLDKRTSRTCRDHDGKEYDIKDAKVGINYPPLHPNCRSTTTPLFDGELARKPKTAEKRVERFASFDNGSVQERWKQAMLKQMNPNKVQHDYNADLNIITQNFQNNAITKAQMDQQINSFMSTLPADYPLRGGLERMARINGWEPDKNIVVVNKMLKDAGIDSGLVKLNNAQSQFIAETGIKIEKFDGGIDTSGVFNPNNNTLGVDPDLIKFRGESLKDPNYANKIVQHELGHAVDSFGPMLKSGVEGNLSDASEFVNIISQSGLKTNEAYAISQYRIANGFPQSDIKTQIESTPIQDYVKHMKTDGMVSTVSITTEHLDYLLDNHELFAEAYSIFHTNPQYLKTNAPKIYEYINSVNKLKL